MLFINYYIFNDLFLNKSNTHIGPCIWQNIKDIKNNFWQTNVSLKAIKRTNNFLDKYYQKEQTAYLCAFPGILTTAKFPPMIFCYHKNNLSKIMIHHYIDDKRRHWAKSNLKDHVHNDTFLTLPFNQIIEKECLIGKPFQEDKLKIKIKTSDETKNITIYQCSATGKMINKGVISYQNSLRMHNISMMPKQVNSILKQDIFDLIKSKKIEQLK